MNFGAPVFLWLLLLAPAAVWLYFYVQRRRMRYTVRFTNVDLLAGIAEPQRPWRRFVPPVVFLIALIVLLLGVARPNATVLVPREQATIVMTMDVSGSMKADDVEPTRLEAARAAARSFVAQLPERFQIGLVTFSDEVQILAQPTTDRQVLEDAFASLRADGGTAMGDGLNESLSLAPNKKKDRNDPRGFGGGRPSPAPQRDDPPLDAILLLSDGKNTSGSVDPLEAADRAARIGIPIYTIALGTPEGVITARDRLGIPRLVQVPPDFETLEEIGETTGAESFVAPSDDDLRAIYESLGSRIGFVEDHEEVTSGFAAAGLLLVLAAGALSLLWNGRLP